jgi:S1-C subfamily serine protease
LHQLAQGSGVLVLEAQEGGPAARSGVLAGDLIVAFDDAPVAGVDDLHRALTAERADVAIEATVLRRNELVAVRVTPETS